MHLYTKVRTIALLAAVCLLTGCPDITYVDLYNNTSEALKVISYKSELIVEPKTNCRFELIGSGLKITSKLGNWSYKNTIPNGGTDSPYYDGSLKLQIDENGLVYALKLEHNAPQKFDVNSQPRGYPLEPNT